MLSTVDKCGELLGLFSQERPEWGVTEISRRLDMPKSSAHAIVSSLAAIGLVQRISNGRYRLGWRINALNSVLMATAACREHGRVALKKLVDRFGETVHLAVLDGANVLFLDKLSGTHAVLVPGAGIGDREPASPMAVGKALLASLPWSEVEASQRLLQQTAPPSEEGLPRWGIDIEYDQLRQELEQVRREHCAFYHSTEFCAVGAPIWDHTASVVASISMSSPTYRFQNNKAKYIEAVCAVTDWVSDRLGAPGSRQRRWANLRQRVEAAQ